MAIKTNPPNWQSQIAIMALESINTIPYPHGGVENQLENLQERYDIAEKALKDIAGIED